jgi:hypothetical protein
MVRVFCYIRKRRVFFECVILVWMLWNGESDHRYRVRILKTLHVNKESQPNRQGRRALHGEE